MHLAEALDVGETCGLGTVGEAIYNIDLHAGQIFSYSEMGSELKELYSEWESMRHSSGLTADSSIVDMKAWLEVMR